MLSIIVCSVNSSKLLKLKENIAWTIGNNIEYEIIVENNLTNPRPIAKVYNEAASRAKYPYLLFIHEDAGFISQNWFRLIEPKLKEKNCGIIGFAGSKVMFNVPGGWFMDPKWIVVNLNQSGEYCCVNSGESQPWNEVVAIDGYAMFLRREIWKESPFDEESLTGFHCYDIDFSLCIAKKYKNYVCGIVLTYHESRGNFDKTWLKETIKLYKNKWKGMLPMMSSDVFINDSKIKNFNERAYFRVIKRIGESSFIPLSFLWGYLKYPMTFRFMEHCVKILFMQTKAIGRIKLPLPLKQKEKQE